jgi:sugar/nucleoside kinase (ribokinase family)
MRDIVVRPEGPIVRGADRRAAISIVPGGSAANLAAWLVHAGLDATMVARVGRDDHARQVEHFRGIGVRPVLAADDTCPTGTLVALIAPDGERSFLTDRGANERLSRADLPDALLDEVAVVHVSGYALLCPGPRAAVLDFMAGATRRGLVATVDPGSLSLLEEVGVSQFLAWTAFAALCFPNADEAAVLTGSTDADGQLAALCRHYPTVIMKRGARGALAASATGESCAVPAIPAAVVDTTGAGDAFLAGFLAAHLTGAQLPESVARGCAFGAKAVGLVGGRPPSESTCKGKGLVPS